MKISKEKIELLEKLYSEIKILEPRWEKAVIGMNQMFSNFEKCTAKIFLEITDLAENDPQFLCDSFKTIFYSGQDITTLLAKYDRIKFENSDLSSKMEFISEIWDLSTLFRMHSFLLAKNELNSLTLNGLKKNDQIFSHFQNLGISTSDKNNFRKIRNCFKHQFSIDGDYLINNKGEQSVKIDEIDILYNKLKIFTLWAITISKACAKYYYKIIFILIVSIFSLVDNNSTNNSIPLAELEKYFPAFFKILEKNRQLKEAKKNNETKNEKLIDKVKRKILMITIKLVSIIFPSEYESFAKDFSNSFESIMSITVNSFFNLSKELKETQNKLTNPNDIQAIENLISIFDVQKQEVNSVLNEELFPNLKKALYLNKK